MEGREEKLFPVGGKRNLIAFTWRKGKKKKICLKRHWRGVAFFYT